MPVEGSVKISRLRLTNETNRARVLSVTAYVEWVLGASRSASLDFIETELDVTTGAMFARNPWNADFGSRFAFVDMRGAQTDSTGDRREFIGRNGALANPAGLGDCGAVIQQGRRRLGRLRRDAHDARGAGGRRGRSRFFLGQAATRKAARAAVQAYRAADLDALEAGVAALWEEA